ncbi:hypothetical protein [Algibacter pacificus]|uniref:hypothetical protein n=1 Tax=Algibacter pacificus TaxID=2599389 RepID=UPI0011CB1107|nr:hypothetical protein [Algibacter pacificus]
MRRLKIIIGILIGCIIIGFFFLQNRFKNEIVNGIETKLPPNIKLDYAKINTSILAGNIQLYRVSIQLFNSNKDLISQIKMDKFMVSGLSFWHFLMYDTIALDAIVLENPNLQHYRNLLKQLQQKNVTDNNQFDKNIVVDKISIINGSFKLYQNNGSMVSTSLDGIHFTLNKCKTNPVQLKEKIPFHYDGFKIKAKEFFTNLSNFETLEIQDLNIEDNQLSLKNLCINPKFTREVLSTKLNVERDYFELHIPEIAIYKLDFGFNNNTFFVAADSSNISKPNLVVYRDKRVADDLRIKRMYSKMLRALDFDFAFSKININDAYMSYAERIEDTDKAGKIFFDSINACLSQLSNTYKKGGKTVLLVDSKFMGQTPMHLDVRFDINNKQDTFLASGALKNFNAEIANAFFKSNLNVKADGEIEQIYFTFSGNNLESQGDLKMKYDNFKFEIINDKNQVNKLFTTIGNLFVNDGSKTDGEGYRHGKIEVGRQTTKSFFNYLWINVESGLISTLTGNGKKA